MKLVHTKLLFHDCKLTVNLVFHGLDLCQRPGKIGCRLNNRCSARRENSSHDFSVGKYFVNLGSPHLTPGLFNTLGEAIKMSDSSLIISTDRPRCSFLI